MKEQHVISFYFSKLVRKFFGLCWTFFAGHLIEFKSSSAFRQFRLHCLVIIHILHPTLENEYSSCDIAHTFMVCEKLTYLPADFLLTNVHSGHAQVSLLWSFFLFGLSAAPAPPGVLPPGVLAGVLEPGVTAEVPAEGGCLERFGEGGGRTFGWFSGGTPSLFAWHT